MEYQFPGQRLGLSFWSGSTESRTQTTRELLIPRSISENSHRGLHDIIQQHPVQDASPKQQGRQKRKPSYQQAGFQKTPQNIPPHTAPTLREREENKQTNKTHHLPPEHRHKSFSIQSLQKPLDHLYLLRAETKSKKEYNPKAWE